MMAYWASSHAWLISTNIYPSYARSKKKHNLEFTGYISSDQAKEKREIMAPIQIRHLWVFKSLCLHQRT